MTNEEIQKNSEHWYNKYKDAEKRNAELKETLKTYNGCGDWDNDFHTCRVYLQHEELQMYINQLTKAKFLLKQLVHTFPKSYSDVVKDTLDEARKFVEE